MKNFVKLHTNRMYMYEAQSYELLQDVYNSMWKTKKWIPYDCQRYTSIEISAYTYIVYL
jgi:hypothetical protein